VRVRREEDLPDADGESSVKTSTASV
jgi:hypothetical protein